MSLPPRSPAALRPLVMLRSDGSLLLPALRRRWRVPPLPEHLRASALEEVVLEELSGEVALVLRQSLRDVLRWSGAAPGGRDGLFRPGAERTRLGPAVVAGRHAELERPLEVLVSVVRDPGAACADAVALACRRVSQWADERGALATALAFAECAAAAAPGDAGMALAAARLARRGEPARAEGWYLRAVRLARLAEDRVTYTLALQGLGLLELRRGRLETAERRYARALRAARGCGARDAEARALHSLFVVAAEKGDVSAAEAYARLALRTYGAGHAQLPVLAHDLAHLWLLRGLFLRSLLVFEALLPQRAQPLDRLYALADVTRAAGGAKRRERVVEAWTEAWELSYRPDVEEGTAASLLDLAHGALGVEEWARAETAARRAAGVAGLRGEARVREEAESLLRAAGARLHPETACDGSAATAVCLEGDELAIEVVLTLAVCAPPSPGTEVHR